MILRAYIIYSNYSLFHAELQILWTYFCNNGYSRFLFDNCVKKFLSNLFEPNITNSNNPNYFYFNVPYFGPQSDNLKIELASLLSKYISDVAPRIVLSNRQSISSLFHYKDDHLCALRSGVVYKYCCARVLLRWLYLSQTSRQDLWACWSKFEDEHPHFPSQRWAVACYM